MNSMKIVVSYPYLFYSLYRFYLTREFSNDWPQGWSVSALSAFLILLVIIIEFELSKYNITIPPESTFVWLSYVNGYIWSAILVCIINFIFFFQGKRWKKYVKRYDTLSEDDRMINHCLSVFILVLMFCFYIYELFTIAPSA